MLPERLFVYKNSRRGHPTLERERGGENKEKGEEKAESSRWEHWIGHINKGRISIYIIRFKPIGKLQRQRDTREFRFIRDEHRSTLDWRDSPRRV